MEARPLRDILRFAIEVARDGELADPPIPAPAPIRRLLTFRRLSKASYETIAEVIDADEGFRLRVATAADEDEVGRAGILFVERPEGWEAELAGFVASGPEDPDERAALLTKLRRAREGAEAAARRLQSELVAANESRDRLSERLAEADERARSVAAEAEHLRADLQDSRDDRSRAVRDLKSAEAELAGLRHDLKVARAATRDAERELSELRTAATAAIDRPLSLPPRSRSGDVPPGPVDPEAIAEPFDRTALRSAVTGAAASAARLADFLLDAERAIGADDPDDAAPSAPSERSSGRRRMPRLRRSAPSLPFGVDDDSARAAIAWTTDPANLVVVDGYNLARTLWEDCTPEEERRRTVAILEELHSRTGITVIVVFDGADDMAAPSASRTVRVRFSPTGVTADQVILELLGDLPRDRPVVVVSSDREIERGARAGGAAVLSSNRFAGAIGR